MNPYRLSSASDNDLAGPREIAIVARYRLLGGFHLPMHLTQRSGVFGAYAQCGSKFVKFPFRNCIVSAGERRALMAAETA